MGVSFNGHAGAIDWIQSRFSKNKPATLYYDEIRTPTYTDCLNRVCQRVLADSISGLYHAGGPQQLSLFQIAQVINRIGGYDPRHLMGCDRIEAGPIPPRAGNVTMDSSRLTRALGFEPFDPWPYYAEHVPTHREWHRERPAGERGSAAIPGRGAVQEPRPLPDLALIERIARGSFRRALGDLPSIQQETNQRLGVLDLPRVDHLPRL